MYSTKGGPIFPSDIVHFRYNNADCRYRQTAQTAYYSQVLAIAKDYRSNRPNGVGIGEIIVKLREIVQAKLLLAKIIPQLVPSAEPNEYFILDRIDFFVLVQNVVAAVPN